MPVCFCLSMKIKVTQTHKDARETQLHKAGSRKHLPASDQSPHTGRAALKHRLTVSTHTLRQNTKAKQLCWLEEAWPRVRQLTMAGMLPHLLAGGISVRRSGLRLMPAPAAGGLLSCMLLDTAPGDSRPEVAQWLPKPPFPGHTSRKRMFFPRQFRKHCKISAALTRMSWFDFLVSDVLKHCGWFHCTLLTKSAAALWSYSST